MPVHVKFIYPISKKYPIDFKLRKPYNVIVQKEVTDEIGAEYWKGNTWIRFKIIIGANGRYKELTHYIS